MKVDIAEARAYVTKICLDFATPLNGVSCRNFRSNNLEQTIVPPTRTLPLSTERENAKMYRHEQDSLDTCLKFGKSLTSNASKWWQKIIPTWIF